MTIIKIYSANKELLVEDKPVDINNVEQYVSQYSPEYAQGYLQALSDFDAELDALIWKKAGTRTRVLSSPAISSTKMMKFHNQKIYLIEKLKSLGIGLPKPDHSPDL